MRARKISRRRDAIDRQRIAEDLAIHLASETNAVERARLLLLLEEIRGPERRPTPSIAAASIFVLCFAVAGLLVLKRVRNITLDAHINTTALSVQPSDPSQSVLRQFMVTEILATEGTVIDRHVHRQGELRHLVRVSCRDNCQMLLDGFDLIGVQEIELQRLGRLGNLRIRLTGKQVRTKITLTGEATLEHGEGQSELFDFAEPEKLTIVGDDRELNVDVRTLTADTIKLSGLGIKALEFRATQEELRNERLVTIRRSGILDGELRLRQVQKSISLLHEDELDLNGFVGKVYELTMKPDHFSVALVGNASDVRLGGEQRSVMPSILETLRARSDLTVYWGSAIWAAGLFISILQWYRTGK